MRPPPWPRSAPCPTPLSSSCPPAANPCVDGLASAHHLRRRLLAARRPAAGVQRVCPRSPLAGLLGRGVSGRGGARGVRPAGVTARGDGPGGVAARDARGGGLAPGAAPEQASGQVVT